MEKGKKTLLEVLTYGECCTKGCEACPPGCAECSKGCYCRRKRKKG